MATASNPKAAHYNTALTAALLRGAWADNTPGSAPNGTELSWGELIRKWGKHTGGNTALIHHLRDISLLYLSSASHNDSNTNTASSGFITVPPPNTSPRIGFASLSLADAGQPGSSNSSASTSGDGGSQSTTNTTGSFVHIPHPHLRHRNKPSIDSTSATGSGSTIRPADPTASASGTGSRAAYLSPADLDGDELDDPTSWAQGSNWWHGVGVDSADEVTEGLRAIEKLIESGKLSPVDATSARLTLAYHLHALAAHDAALGVYDSIDWVTDGRLGVVHGDAAVLERIRGRCLQGLSAELSPKPNPSFALQCYLSMIPLLKSLTSFVIPTPAHLLLQPAISKLPLDSHRELYRFLSTALTRAAVLSARQPSSIQQTLRILRTYHAFSASWPPAFRPKQRQNMGELHLRALASSYPAAGAGVDQPCHLDGGSSTLSAHVLWRKEAIEAIRQGRQLLSTTTTFPRAGSVNVKVKTFSNLTVALYGKCTALGREVIAVLWWAMTLTFQSQSILRHLTRLLADVGDSTDARRAFELYVQLVLKARQTQQPEISLQLKRRPTDEDAAGPAQIQQEAETADPEDQAKKSQEAEAELDSNHDFVIALLGGARLLCRDLGEPEEAWRYACLAGDVIANRKAEAVLRARVEESKGIIRMAMAAKGADPISRPTYQAQAIDHLVAATSLHPTASGFYHLAYCQAEARSIDAATESIRSSLETDSQNVQSWHLLALLLTAKRDWEGAIKACEAGVSVWEEDEETLIAHGFDELESGGAGEVLDSNVASRDFAVITASPTITGDHQSSTTNSRPLLKPDGTFCILSQEAPHVTPLTRSARLEHVIRLRTTLNVIIEKTLGAEVAMLKQQELFAFFSARSGKNRGKLGYAAVRSVQSNGSLAQMAGVGYSVPGGGLEGSYISIGPAGRDEGNPNGGGVSVQPPTPTAQSASRPSFIVQSANSSPGNSSPDQPSDSDVDEKGSRRKLSEKTSKRISRHLHVPGHGHGHHGRHGGSGSVSRPSSVRRITAETITEKSPSALATGRQRAFSNSSAALSIAPTAVHSHFHNASTRRSQTPLPPPLPTNGTGVEEHGRTPGESRILSNLWLMSAATFRRWGKLEQSLVAIEEAEVLDPENADVWVQLGLYHIHTNAISHHDSEQGENPEKGLTIGLQSAEASFVKSLLLTPDHPPAIIGLSKLYLSTNQIALAESLLNQLTQDGGGWDVPEAWFYLGKVVDQQGRRERARECWTFALGLEERRGVRGWNEVGRWL